MGTHFISRISSSCFLLSIRRLAKCASFSARDCCVEARRALVASSSCLVFSSAFISSSICKAHGTQCVISPPFKHKALCASLCSDHRHKGIKAILELGIVSWHPLFLCHQLKINISNTRSVQISKGPHSIGLSTNFYRNCLIYLLEVEGEWLDPTSTCLANISDTASLQLAEGNTQNAFCPAQYTSVCRPQSILTGSYSMCFKFIHVLTYQSLVWQKRFGVQRASGVSLSPHLPVSHSGSKVWPKVNRIPATKGSSLVCP